MSEQPTEIKLHQQSRLLEIAFDDGVTYQLPCEYLRVYSPSADVSGHGPGQEVLQVGKKNVGISELVPVGSYAVQINFDDGHDTGLYTWEYLYRLGKNQSVLVAGLSGQAGCRRSQPRTPSGRQEITRKIPDKISRHSLKSGTEFYIRITGANDEF